MRNDHVGPRGVTGVRPVPRGRSARHGWAQWYPRERAGSEETVAGGDGSDADKLATLAVDDVSDFWRKHFTESFRGSFTPVGGLVSYDSDDPSNPEICGGQTYGNPNALYCPSDDLIAWDRGVLVPLGQRFFGDASIAALLSHEYGHAV